MKVLHASSPSFDSQTHHNELKKERRANKALAGNEDDIEAMLAKCLLEDKARTVLTLEPDCPAPSARVNSSFVPFIAPVGRRIKGAEVKFPLLYHTGLYCLRCRCCIRCINDLGLQKVNEIIMFGGECVDPISSKVRVFNDLYRFNCDKEKWTRVLSPGW